MMLDLPTLWLPSKATLYLVFTLLVVVDIPGFYYNLGTIVHRLANTKDSDNREYKPNNVR